MISSRATQREDTCPSLSRSVCRPQVHLWAVTGLSSLWPRVGAGADANGDSFEARHGTRQASFALGKKKNKAMV